MTPDQQKRAAAARSLDYMEDGMVVGLGTGSTAAHLVDLLGEKVRAGFRVTCLATSEATARQARDNGIRIVGLDAVTRIDLTIDGADELDGSLRLIKGGGGALLREKIVASQSERMIVIADASKKVTRLGAFPLPVEVIGFAAPALLRRLAALGCTPRIREDGNGAPFHTDEGNLIIDCPFGAIDDPEALAAELDRITGIVEHGLFIGLASLALLGGPNGVETVALP
ncbi:ribose-5-phosphate isomerase RpiA [Oceanibacterium hippocampi]|uniref:Ribose-5-phosphate isomerase A n=1 Tax=Oceanibacterium hippocampi TaxID=745714 RepID=A0A1Y5RFE8_9PROT|nr:ribose-5-phosphate isomerase RpiA [Oceanibacterium hippocampi]SLN15318.1 Ribose-5-phosphate isomerase A [Oceanibacterium hippocampi]